jgi:hypothetical protein
MRRFRAGLVNVVRRTFKIRGRSPEDAADDAEVRRLNAEYTGSFARNAGQELGIVPDRYGQNP